jgi:hypothetical protein
MKFALEQSLDQDQWAITNFSRLIGAAAALDGSTPRTS